MEKKLIFMLLKSDGRTWHLASGQQTSELMWGCARLQGWRRNSDRDRTGQQHHWVSFTCVFLRSAEDLHFGNHRNHMIPYQLFHLAACADEESLVDSQRCVDCSGIQLQLGSLCVGFTRELLASHTDQEQQTTRSLWYLFFLALVVIGTCVPTSCGVHLDEDVIPTGFDNRWHHILNRRTDWQHQREGLVVWPVDLIQHCTKKKKKKHQGVLFRSRITRTTLFGDVSKYSN